MLLSDGRPRRRPLSHEFCEAATIRHFPRGDFRSLTAKQANLAPFLPSDLGLLRNRGQHKQRRFQSGWSME